MRKRPTIFKWKYLFVLIPLLVYLTSLTQYWICSDDSALYIYQARSYYLTGVFTQNGQPNLVASPGFPMLIAGLMKIGGDSNYFFMQSVMVLCGLGGLAIAYRQQWIWTTRFRARWVVLGTTMSYCFYHNIRRVLTEAPSFLLFWLIIALLRASKTNKWYLVLTALAGYAAVFTRIPATLAIASIGVAALFERRLVSDKFHWRFLGVCVLALGVIAGWLHVRFIASAYQQIAPYSSSGSFFNFEDPWSTVVDNVGRMFSHLCLGQRNCAVGLVILTLIVWAGLYCHRHRNRKLVFPIAFIVAYSTLMISSVGGWTMTSRYWFYALPLVIYYLFKAIELMGGLATKALRLRRALLPLPKFAAIGICVLVLIQLPLIVRSNFVAMYGWGHSREQFYKKFNHGRNAEIMSLVDELAMEKSRAWIATSGKTTILLAFTGRYVHCLGKEPLDVIRSEQWREHPPAVVLLERPKSTDDASDMQVHRQLMDVFGADREHWALDRETERWLVFRRKIGQAQAGR